MRKFKNSLHSLVNEEHMQEKKVKQAEWPKEKSWLDLITAGKFITWMKWLQVEEVPLQRVCVLASYMISEVLL